MADFAPPPGPPPPKVPEGWKAVYNTEYKEWFFVNIHTKASQWDKPTEPVYAGPGRASSDSPPPGYDHSASRATVPEKGSNNPYTQSGSTADDEALARKLQAEEQGRATGSTDRGASDSYYGQGNSQSTPYGQNASPYGQQQQQQQGLPPRDDKSRGIFGKLTSKLGGGPQSRPPQQGYGGGYPQQQYGGGYPQQGYPPQQGYGGYPPQGYPPQGYPPQGGGYYPQQAPPKRTGGGMGAMGGGLLGAGAGLVGGALLMDAFENHDQNEYNQGYEAGADNGGDGGDYGGDGGGDFGGGDGGDF